MQKQSSTRSAEVPTADNDFLLGPLAPRFKAIGDHASVLSHMDNLLRVLVAVLDREESLDVDARQSEYEDQRLLHSASVLLEDLREEISGTADRLLGLCPESDEDFPDVKVVPLPIPKEMKWIRERSGGSPRRAAHR